MEEKRIDARLEQKLGFDRIRKAVRCTASANRSGNLGYKRIGKPAMASRFF